MSRLGLVFIALGIGVAMVALNKVASAGPITVSILEVMLLVMVAIPFLVLAMGGIRARLPWLTGLALTFITWGYMLWGTGQPPAGGRAGTGTGFALIVLMSPLIISIACIAAYAIEGRRRV